MGETSDRDRGAPPDDPFLDRAWTAWHSMPRRASGKPPSWRSIELEHTLAEGTFSKMFKGHRHEHSMAMYTRIAKALRADVLWLVHGVGAAPTPTGPVPSRFAPPERSMVERAVATFQRALHAAGVPLPVARAATNAASEALHVDTHDAPVDKGSAKDAAVDFARANGLPAPAIERAVAMPAPTSWTAEQWYTRIKSLAAEMG